MLGGLPGLLTDLKVFDRHCGPDEGAHRIFSPLGVKFKAQPHTAVDLEVLLEAVARGLQRNIDWGKRFDVKRAIAHDNLAVCAERVRTTLSL